jgi:quercetin dioxygenase-like cupin family protein
MKWVYRSEAEAEAARIVEDWGSLNWLSGEELTGSDVTVGRVMIKKGMSNPQHAHPNCTEVLYMLEGTLEHTVDGETVVTRAGDTIIVPAGVVHVARNVGDGDADMIVAYPSGRRGFQTV